jgi:hypothetical protein
MLDYYFFVCFLFRSLLHAATTSRSSAYSETVHGAANPEPYQKYMQQLTALNLRGCGQRKDGHGDFACSYRVIYWAMVQWR